MQVHHSGVVDGQTTDDPDQMEPVLFYKTLERKLIIITSVEAAPIPQDDTRNTAQQHRQLLYCVII